MTAFVAIADLGSFAAAARQLRTSPQAVTRAIAGLEERLNALLFHRTTRSVRLTEEGAAFLVRCRQVLADLNEAERALTGGAAEPHGVLTVTASQLFGRMHVIPIVRELLERHPKLSVRLLMVDRFVNLAEEGVDVAVRIGELADSALQARRVGAVRRILVASPEYLDRAGTPTQPSDLRRHAVVSFTGTSPSDEWRFGPSERMSVHVRPRLVTTSAESAIEAAEAGIGVVRVLSYQVARQLEDGRLVELMEELAPPPVPVHVVFQAARGSAPNVRSFVEAAVRHLQAVRL